MDSIKFDPTSLLMDSSIGVTIYDANFELISWNSEYADLGITPKSDLREGLNLKETYSIAYRLGVFDCQKYRDAEERFRCAREKKSPEVESLNLPSSGTVTVRRIFLPGIGVAALFQNPSQILSRTQRHIAHLINNHLAKILINLELASIAGNDSYLNKAKELCSASIKLNLTSDE